MPLFDTSNRTESAACDTVAVTQALSVQEIQCNNLNANRRINVTGSIVVVGTGDLSYHIDLRC